MINFLKIKKVALKFFSNDSLHYDTKELAGESKAFLYPSQKKYVLRTKKSKRLLVLIIAHSFLAYALIDDPRIFYKAFVHFSIGTVILCIYLILVLPIIWYHFFDNKPQITISDRGILFAGKGFLDWKIIRHTVIQKANVDGIKYYLILETEDEYGDRQQEKMEITYLDKSPEDVAQIIEKLKNSSS